MADIRNAINADKHVTAHQNNISYKGWTGSGYIILDPTTGTGAYLIDGGANGAFINGAIIGSALALFTLSFDSVINLKVANDQLLTVFTLLLVTFLVSFLAGTVIIANIQGWEDEEWGCFLSGVLTGFAVGATASKFFPTGKANVTWAIGSALTALGIFSGWNGKLPSPGACL